MIVDLQRVVHIGRAEKRATDSRRALADGERGPVFALCLLHEEVKFFCPLKTTLMGSRVWNSGMASAAGSGAVAANTAKARKKQFFMSGGSTGSARCQFGICRADAPPWAQSEITRA